MGVNNLNYSKNGLALTELFEGDILTAYQDPRGIWTIGYGHTASVRPGETITQEQAVALLFSDLRAAVHCVNEVVTAKLTQSQFDALVDFVFNLGIANFRHSTLLRDVNAAHFPEAVAQFRLWDHCGGIVNAGLLRRRNAEAAEFSGNTRIGDVSASIAFV
ncbi:MAG TPA: lysozyme [Acidobacteriaceae bacterium]|nr:lysozyme [Acidobacteriaceae bacterium]